MKKSHKNRGRNVINIDELRNYLENYATKRNLSTPIVSWLQKTFVRWLINHFEEVEVVESVKRYEALVGGEIPAWFTPYADSEFTYVHIKNPTFTDTLHTCVEFLSSRDEKISHKFPRMTVEHVMEKSRQEHLKMQERQRKNIETSQEALAHVFSFGNMHVVKFLPHHEELSLEMARESALMQHCLGEFDDIEKAQGGYGSYYFGLIQREEITLYSLRDDKNMPHATISVGYKRGKAQLNQIKGKQNQPPVSRYIAASVAFFNHLSLEHNYHPDCLGMGVVFVQGKSQQLSTITDEAVQQHLIAYDSKFIEALPNPSKSSLWLAALRNPKKMGSLKETNNAMKVAALIQHPLLMNELDFTHNLQAKDILQQTKHYKIAQRPFIFPKLEVGRI